MVCRYLCLCVDWRAAADEARARALREAAVAPRLRDGQAELGRAQALELSRVHEQAPSDAELPGGRLSEPPPSPPPGTDTT